MNFSNIFRGALIWSPILVTLLPEEHSSLGFLILLVCAFLYCFCLKENAKFSLDLAILPAFICVLSGIGALLNFDQITLSNAADRFCHFIVGVWFIAAWCKIKSLEKEK